jgi:hypothetical protein
VVLRFSCQFVQIEVGAPTFVTWDMHEIRWEISNLVITVSIAYSFGNIETLLATDM